jgi:hypothetical protein
MVIPEGLPDLTFGIEEGGGSLTRMLIHRDTIPAGPAGAQIVDVDLGGPAGFVPEKKSITIRGVPEGGLHSGVQYATRVDKEAGIDLTGPSTVTGSDVSFDHAVVPQARQAANDRYRGHFSTAASSVAWSIHTAIDIDIVLPLPPAPPAVTLIGKDLQADASGYPRARFEHPAIAGVESYELEAYWTSRLRYSKWTVSMDAAYAGSGTVTTELPDFSLLPGWSADWTPRYTQLTLAVEWPGVPLSDGTLHRSAKSASGTLTP